MRKIHTVLVFLSRLVSLAFSKDSQPARSGRAGSATERYLNAAADAVLNLKSAQFTLKREGTPAFLDEKNGITFTLAECSYAAPDRVSCNVKISLKNGNILQLTRVWVPEGVFQTNPLTRQFGKAPADASFNGAALFAKTGIADLLRTGTRNPQLVGKEKLHGKDTLHLKGEVSGEKLNPLVGSTLKPEFMHPVDMWMEEKSSRPVQVHVSEPEGNGWLIELFAMDVPVDIPTPKLPPPPAPKPQA
jgi:LppX_LprAFG lipoprotein